MQPLTRASAREFSRVRFVLTDMDENAHLKDASARRPMTHWNGCSARACG